MQPYQPHTGYYPPQPAQHDGLTQHELPALPQYGNPRQYYQQPQYPPLSQPPRESNTSTRSFLVVLGAIIVVLVLGLAVARWIGGQPLAGTDTTHNAGMSVQQYKDSTTDTTVANLDKDGNLDSGKDFHFTATILAFVKDSNGDTAGANVSDPTTFTSIIQIEFPTGTDVTQLNVQDKIEVWGTDEGTATGTNAFGATVHEVAVMALYLTDQTTGYTTG